MRLPEDTASCDERSKLVKISENGVRRQLGGGDGALRGASAGFRRLPWATVGEAGDFTDECFMFCHGECFRGIGMPVSKSQRTQRTQRTKKLKYRRCS